MGNIERRREDQQRAPMQPMRAKQIIRRPIPEPPRSKEVEVEIAALVLEFKREHEAVVTSARTTLRRAIKAGEILSKIKDRVGHGHWLKWLRRHQAEVSERTGQKYILLWEQREQFMANPPSTADLTIEQALHRLKIANHVARHETPNERIERFKMEAAAKVEQQLLNGDKRIDDAELLFKILRTDIVTLRPAPTKHAIFTALINLLAAAIIRQADDNTPDEASVEEARKATEELARSWAQKLIEASLSTFDLMHGDSDEAPGSTHDSAVEHAWSEAILFKDLKTKIAATKANGGAKVNRGAKV